MTRRHDLDRDAMGYWRQQSREATRQRGQARPPFRSGERLTFILIGLMVLEAVLASFLPLTLWAYSVPVVGRLVLDLLSSITPGGLLGLIFAALFTWALGSQLEYLDRPWKFLVLFFLSGTLGAWAAGLFGLGLISTMGPFGLAGAYAFLMSRQSFGGQSAALRWVVGLLLLNVLLGGFQLAGLAAMVVSFGVGFGFAYATGYGL